MGYRGEDRSREREAWGAQSPRQSSREHAGYGSSSYDSAGYDGASYDSASYGDGTDYSGTAYSGTNSYEAADHDGAGYDGYAQGGDYQSGGYATGGFSTGRHGTGGHQALGYGGDGYDGASYDSTTSYDSGSGYGGASHDDGYGSAGHRTGSFGTSAASGYSDEDYSDYGSDHSSGNRSAQGFHGAPLDGTSYGSATSSDSPTSYNSGTSHDGGTSRRGSFGSGPYPALGRPSGPYPALGQSSGPYPALGHPSGPHPGLGHPSGPHPGLGHPSGPYPALGRSSSGEYPVLEPDPYDDGNDWYARSGPIPAGGFADTSAQIAVRDPVRDPVRGYPPEPARPDPGLATTRQQQRYDESEFVSYPGYEGVDDGYSAPRGYGYDDYGDQTRLDQVAIDYDAPNGARGFGQALQDGDFDNDRYRDGYDDYAVGDEIRGGPRTGPQRLDHGGKRSKKQQKKASAASRDLARQPKRSRLGLVLTVTGVVVVGAVGYGGYRVYEAKSKANNNQEAAISQPLPSVVPSSANQQCAAQFGGPFCHIEQRTDDPTPLTVSEVFPPSVFNEASKLGFSLAATNVNTDCTKAVYGADLMKQLKAGQCNQALRASYVSQDGTMMGTIGVFNLVSTNQAHYAAKLIGASDFMLPLAGKGAIAKLGNGTGVVETEYKGHYLIVTWSQFTSGKAPTTAQTQQLEDFDSALLAGTANSYLSDRMVNGVGTAATPSATSTAASSPSATTSAH